MSRIARKDGPAPETVKPEPKYKLTISLDPPLARRFASYCGLMGRDQSDVAAEAFRTQLRGFVVSFRGAKSPVAPEPEADPALETDAGDGPDLRVAG